MTPMQQALDLLAQCARQLASTGGMMNRDLAHDVAKFVTTHTDTPKPFVIGEGLRGATVRVWQKDDTAKPHE